MTIMVLIDYIRILRPANCAMASAGVLAGGFLVLKSASPQVFLAMLAAFLITGAGNAINDWADVESDRINKPKRPIPSGRVSRSSILLYSCVLFLAGIAITLPAMGFGSWHLFAIALINSAVLIAYSCGLEDKLFAGNLSISYLVASSFIFGGAAAGNILVPLLMAVLAFLSNTAREIVKDLEDVEGDKASFLKNISLKARKTAERFSKCKGGIKMKVGENRLAVTAGLFLMMSIAFSPLPYVMKIMGFNYLVLLIPADLFFLWALHGLAKSGNKKRQFASISKKIKFGMLFGLIAFMAGAAV
jgi:geranylgeranylglycerol-phosphate geranylgeranyltransferase